LYARYDDESIRKFEEYYAPLNPWISGLAKIPVGVAHRAEDFLDRETLFESEFYNDWIRPQEDIGTGGGIVIFREAGRMLTVSGNIRLKDSQEVQDQLISTLDLLGPHLRQAFDIQRTLEGHRLVDRQYREALDKVSNPIFLIDHGGRVSHVNASAEAMLRASKTFSISSSKVLHCEDQRANSQITHAIRAITSGQAAVLGSSVVAVGRSDGRPMMATIVPFQIDQDRTGIFADFPAARIPLAMVTVLGGSRSSAALHVVLASAYSLTETEVRLVEALRNGLSVAEYAATAGRSINTVRNQLRSILEKTDTHRQGELIALVNNLVP
jgi:DNA-binding CsgD family transcriptional regulator/PAS domain-containing protein